MSQEMQMVSRGSEKIKNGFFPEPSERMNSADTLTLAQLNWFQTSSVWNHKKTEKIYVTLSYQACGYYMGS